MKKVKKQEHSIGYEVILLAAGQGKRMNLGKNKILLHLNGIPVISYSLRTFLQDTACQHIILVVQEEERELLEAILKKEEKNNQCVITIVSGGSERQYSVFNGLKAMRDFQNIVMVHDGARPFVSLKQVHLLVEKVKKTRAAILGVPVKDTIKKVVNGMVEKTIPRDTLWQIQTPQAFYGNELLAVHAIACEENFLGTDDASLIEKYSNLEVSMVLGSYENIKLTTFEDMVIGEAIINRRRN